MLVVFSPIVPSGYQAIAVWPFIVLKDKALKKKPELLRHERIHLRQQLELLWVFFFVFYLLEFWAKIIIYGKSRLAYRNISFEREAYQNEHRQDYLKKRPLFNFMKYL